MISPAHPGPFPAIGEGGGGKVQMLPQATLGAILCAVRIDFGLPSKINPYPAQPATGVLGQRPKRVLVPFTRVKGTPRRRAVLIMPSKRLSPPEVTTNPPRRVGVPTKAFYKTFPTGGDSRLFHERPGGEPC